MRAAPPLGSMVCRQTQQIPMSRYFFDIMNGDCSVDHDGLTLPDRNSIPRAALNMLLDVAKLETIDSGTRTLAVAVRDEASEVIYKASVTVDAHWMTETLPPLHRPG